MKRILKDELKNGDTRYRVERWSEGNVFRTGKWKTEKIKLNREEASAWFPNMFCRFGVKIPAIFNTYKDALAYVYEWDTNNEKRKEWVSGQEVGVIFMKKEYVDDSKEKDNEPQNIEKEEIDETASEEIDKKE